MSAIEMRSYATSGLVSVETVNALIAFGEPMVTDTRGLPGYEDSPPFRAWIRLRVQPCGCAGGRTMGRPDLSPQFAAENLLRKIRGTK